LTATAVPMRTRSRQKLPRASEGAGSAVTEMFWRPRPEAVALLSQVMSRLPASDVFMVQFVASLGDAGAGRVARDFALASVAVIGRTLLLSAGVMDVAEDLPGMEISWRGTDRGRAKFVSIVPDSGISGLYYARLAGTAAEAARISKSPQGAWLGAGHDFRMLVFESPPPSRSPATMALAACCQGSVLAVGAGATRLADLQATAGQVQRAGGTLLGTVLYDAPSVRRATPWRNLLRR